MANAMVFSGTHVVAALYFAKPKLIARSIYPRPPWVHRARRQKGRPAVRYESVQLVVVAVQCSAVHLRQSHPP